MRTGNEGRVTFEEGEYQQMAQTFEPIAQSSPKGKQPKEDPENNITYMSYIDNLIELAESDERETIEAMRNDIKEYAIWKTIHEERKTNYEAQAKLEKVKSVNTHQINIATMSQVNDNPKSLMPTTAELRERTPSARLMPQRLDDEAKKRRPSSQMQGVGYLGHLINKKDGKELKGETSSPIKNDTRKCGDNGDNNLGTEINNNNENNQDTLLQLLPGL